MYLHSSQLQHSLLRQELFLDAFLQQSTSLHHFLVPSILFFPPPSYSGYFLTVLPHDLHLVSYSSEDPVSVSLAPEDPAARTHTYSQKGGVLLCVLQETQ